MKVLVISPTFPPMRSGGAEYAFHLCLGLAARGLQIHVVTSRIRNVVAHPAVAVSPVMRRWSWAELPRLWRVIRRASPDIVNVHFHGRLYHDQPMITILPALLKRRMPRVRVVTLVEYPVGARPERTSIAARLVRKVATMWAGLSNLDYRFGALLSMSDRIVVLSGNHVAMLAEHETTVDAKTIVLPPPPLMQLSPDGGDASRQETRRDLSMAPGDVLLAYFGYVYPGKGLETLFEALSMCARTPRIRLVIIGGANEVMLEDLQRPEYVQELKTLSERLGIARDIIWTGYYPTESDVASRYLRAADMAVLPFDAGAHLNNSSLAAASAHALPIVTTSSATSEPAFRDRNNVMLVPPQDARALAGAIDAVIADPALGDRLRRGAAELAATWFSWDTTLQRTEDVFHGR